MCEEKTRKEEKSAIGRGKGKKNWNSVDVELLVLADVIPKERLGGGRIVKRGDHQLTIEQRGGI